MNIRLATAADLPAVMALEQQCASAAHWPESQYRNLLQNETAPTPSPRIVLLMEQESTSLISEPPPLGFLVAHEIHGEWELENIAVAPGVRRKGIATQLVLELLRRCRQAEGDALFLEVRESNFSARFFYESLGFTPSGRRKAYYQNPDEDSLLYRLNLF